MSASLRFTTMVEAGGGNATGLPVPDEVLAALGAGKRPRVRVRIGGHSFATSVGALGGRSLIPLSAANRAAAGVSAGEQVEVEIEHDDTLLETPVPEDLVTALADEPAARAFFDALAPSHRKEWVRWIEEAKRPETRSRRVAATVEALLAGRRGR